MLKRTLVWLMVIGVALCVGTRTTGAQEPSKRQSDDTEKAPAAYRLDFAIHEVDEGKRVNTRQYSMYLVRGVAWQDLKIGTRMPVELKQGEMQYIDVGTNISARLPEAKDALVLDVRTDLSNFATPNPEHQTSMPLLRQLRINGSTLVTSGKPIIIGSVDDPNSKRQYQLEVTVTQLK